MNYEGDKLCSIILHELTIKRIRSLSKEYEIGFEILINDAIELWAELVGQERTWDFISVAPDLITKDGKGVYLD